MGWYFPSLLGPIKLQGKERKERECLTFLHFFFVFKHKESFGIYIPNFLIELINFSSEFIWQKNTRFSGDLVFSLVYYIIKLLVFFNSPRNFFHQMNTCKKILLLFLYFSSLRKIWEQFSCTNCLTSERNTSVVPGFESWELSSPTKCRTKLSKYWYECNVSCYQSMAFNYWIYHSKSNTLILHHSQETLRGKNWYKRCRM